MEILDVFKNLNSQVMGLQNRQVQGFQESLKPKTQRDLGAEVNVDKAVENINKLLDTKLGALEFVVQNINPENRGTSALEELAVVSNRNVFYTSLAQVNNTGDLVPLWNSIVRAYQEVGVNRETQQIIKVKVQELTPNLEAVVYGLNQAIDTIFGKKLISVSFAGTILELLRTLSVYSEIKAQVDSNPPRFELFNVSLLDRAFKNVFDSQSADRLQILKEYAPRGLATSSTIRNIPDFQLRDIRSRLEAVEEELGVRFDEARKRMLYDKLSGLSGADLTNAINEIRGQIVPQSKSINADEKEALDAIQRASMDLDNLVGAIDENAERRALNDREIEDLEMKEALSPEEIRAQLMDIPEEPVEPDRPEIEDYYNEDNPVGSMFAYEEAMQPYHDWERAVLDRERIIAHNERITNLGIQSSAERQERIDDLREANTRLLENAEELRTHFDVIDNVVRNIRDEVNDRKLTKLNPVIDSVFAGLKEKPMQRENKAEARIKSEVMGFGKPVERRAMSSIKKGYGYQDINIQKKKVMDFDDRRNDNYYTKPVM